MKHQKERPTRKDKPASAQQTPDDRLTIAIQARKVEDAITALNSGADPNSNGGRPIRWATETGQVDMLNLLLERGAHIKGLDLRSLTQADQQGHYATLVFLLKQAPGFEPTTLSSLLYDAAKNGRFNTVRLLLEHQVSIITPKGNALLIAAIQQKKPIVALFMAQSKAEIVNTLHQALMAVLKQGLYDMTHYLINQGVNPFHNQCEAFQYVFKKNTAREISIIELDLLGLMRASPNWKGYYLLLTQLADLTPIQLSRLERLLAVFNTLQLYPFSLLDESQPLRSEPDYFISSSQRKALASYRLLTRNAGWLNIGPGETYRPIQPILQLPPELWQRIFEIAHPEMRSFYNYSLERILAYCHAPNPDPDLLSHATKKLRIIPYFSRSLVKSFVEQNPSSCKAIQEIPEPLKEMINLPTQLEKIIEESGTPAPPIFIKLSQAIQAMMIYLFHHKSFVLKISEMSEALAGWVESSQSAREAPFLQLAQSSLICLNCLQNDPYDPERKTPVFRLMAL